MQRCIIPFAAACYHSKFDLRGKQVLLMTPKRLIATPGPAHDASKQSQEKSKAQLMRACVLFCLLRTEECVGSSAVTSCDRDHSWSR